MNRDAPGTHYRRAHTYDMYATMPTTRSACVRHVRVDAPDQWLVPSEKVILL